MQMSPCQAHQLAIHMHMCVHTHKLMPPAFISSGSGPGHRSLPFCLTPQRFATCCAAPLLPSGADVGQLLGGDQSPPGPLCSLAGSSRCSQGSISCKCTWSKGRRCAAHSADTGRAACCMTFARAKCLPRLSTPLVSPLHPNIDIHTHTFWLFVGDNIVSTCVQCCRDCCLHPCHS